MQVDTKLGTVMKQACDRYTDQGDIAIDKVKLYFLVRQYAQSLANANRDPNLFGSLASPDSDSSNNSGSPDSSNNLGSPDSSNNSGSEDVY
jgi:hypothetical protein